MSRSLNGVIHLYSYDGNEEVGSYDSAGKSIDLKVLSGGEGSLPIAIEIGQQLYAPLVSVQGHIVGLINANTGGLVDYSPLTMFGEDLSDTPLSPWRFCGKRHETAVLGIVDFGFRYYHPKSAQWLTQDPLGESEGANLYAYVRNNPTRCIDRYGLFMDDFNFSDSWGSFKQGCSVAWNNRTFLGNRFVDNFSDGALHPIDSMQRGIVGEDFGISLNQMDSLEKQGHHVGMLGKTVGQAASVCMIAKTAQFVSRVGAYGCAYLSSQFAGRSTTPAAEIGARTSTQLIKPTENVVKRPFIDFIWSEVKTGKSTTHNGWTNVGKTLERIKNNGSFPHRNDGGIFSNRENLLPNRPLGYYTEFVHPTPGIQGAGPQRIITGLQGEIYYTPNHYQNFTQLN